MTKNVVILILAVVAASTSYYAYREGKRADFTDRIMLQRDGTIASLRSALDHARKAAEDNMTLVKVENHRLDSVIMACRKKR